MTAKLPDTPRRRIRKLERELAKARRLIGDLVAAYRFIKEHRCGK